MEKEFLDEVVVNYIKKAEDFIDKYGKIFKMMSDTTITSYEVNHSLIEWNMVASEITKELVRKTANNQKLKIEYELWNDKKFIEAKRKVSEEQTGKSTIPNLTEIQTQVRIDNEVEYREWQYKLMLSQSDVDLIDKIRKDFYQVADNLKNINFSLNAERKSI